MLDSSNRVKFVILCQNGKLRPETAWVTNYTYLESYEKRNFKFNAVYIKNPLKHGPILFRPIFTPKISKLFLKTWKNPEWPVSRSFFESSRSRRVLRQFRWFFFHSVLSSVKKLKQDQRIWQAICYKCMRLIIWNSNFQDFSILFKFWILH